MYIRTKRIKKEEYAYLVNSKWDRRSSTSKQQFSAYLGRIFNPEKQYNLKLTNVVKMCDLDTYLGTTLINNIIKDLITVDLLNHNFRRNKDIFESNGYYINLANLKVYNAKFNPCVIKINNGYLCDYTLKNLLNVAPSSTNEIDFGKKLARVFIEAGVGIDKDLFVLVFDKIYKKEAS